MLVRARPFLVPNEIFDVLSSSRADIENSIEEFEHAFARIVGVAHCYAVHQGRDALVIALKSMDIKAGDEIIVQSFICHVVIDAILRCGGTPVLAENSLSDFNISAQDVEHKISPKTKAIIVTHLYGIPAEMDHFKEIARKHSCYLIEDCAHAISAQYSGKNIGQFGDIAFFSFNFDKPLSTGLGGMLAVNNQELLSSVQKVLLRSERCTIEEEKKILIEFALEHYLTDEKNYQTFLPTTFASELMALPWGISKEIEKCVLNKSFSALEKPLLGILKKKSLLKIIRHTRSIFHQNGLKSPRRMNFMRSHLGLLQLRHLSIVEKIKQRSAKFYQNALQNTTAFQLPQIGEMQEPSFLRYTILNLSNFSRNELFERAAQIGIELDNHNWTYAIHSLSQYHKKVKYNSRTLQNSQFLAEHIIHLPTHYYANDEQRQKIIDILKLGA